MHALYIATIILVGVIITHVVMGNKQKKFAELFAEQSDVVGGLNFLINELYQQCNIDQYKQLGLQKAGQKIANSLLALGFDMDQLSVYAAQGNLIDLNNAFLAILQSPEYKQYVEATRQMSEHLGKIVACPQKTEVDKQLLSTLQYYAFLVDAFGGPMINHILPMLKHLMP